MSITAKKRGSVRNSLTRRVRVSTTRAQCCGTIDELISQIGFARSICSDMEVRNRLKVLQLELYKVGAAIATPREANELTPEITPAMMEALEAEVHRIESVPGVLADGSLFWELPDAAALDLARTVCRRTERVARTLLDEREISTPSIPAYLNRLSDLLWLLGRLLESRQGIVS